MLTDIYTVRPADGQLSAGHLRRRRAAGLDHDVNSGGAGVTYSGG
ncbi:MAG: hypothetical protein ACLU38_10300 [Dysosmobacter sp.]